MMNIYLVERKDNETIYDSVVSMVVVAKDGLQAKKLSLERGWGDLKGFHNGRLADISNLKATKINLDVAKVVMVDMLNG